MNVVMTVFWGVVVLLVLVVIHELGHFIAARAFGVRVTEFMIGLPGPNIGFEHNGCRYGITC
ncbi:MAG: site-2 protease family protein, partial [Coriobacteriales bacterium]|nr:site-2 protease family protein [Coriobacteriales bacterium]